LKPLDFVHLQFHKLLGVNGSGASCS